MMIRTGEFKCTYVPYVPGNIIARSMYRQLFLFISFHDIMTLMHSGLDPFCRSGAFSRDQGAC